MNLELQRWYLDFDEKGQMWHIDLNRVPENESWKNICYGKEICLSHFCEMVDMMRREFGMNFTAKQIIRLAECTPGLTIYRATSIPHNPINKELHMAPICLKKQLDKYIQWKDIDL